MGTKVKIVYDREGCISALSCINMDGDHFKLGDDGKADLTSFTKNEDGHQVWEVEVADLDKLVNAAKACPVSVIKVFTQEGKELVFGEG